MGRIHPALAAALAALAVTGCFGKTEKPQAATPVILTEVAGGGVDAENAAMIRQSTQGGMTISPFFQSIVDPETCIGKPAAVTVSGATPSGLTTSVHTVSRVQSSNASICPGATVTGTCVSFVWTGEPAYEAVGGFTIQSQTSGRSWKDHVDVDIPTTRSVC